MNQKNFKLLHVSVMIYAQSSMQMGTKFSLASTRTVLLIVFMSGLAVNAISLDIVIQIVHRIKYAGTAVLRIMTPSIVQSIAKIITHATNAPTVKPLARLVKDIQVIGTSARLSSKFKRKS